MNSTLLGLAALLMGGFFIITGMRSLRSGRPAAFWFGRFTNPDQQRPAPPASEQPRWLQAVGRFLSALWLLAGVVWLAIGVAALTGTSI